MATSAKSLVSVIIAFLNEEKFLDEAIKSVLQQDYYNWELILVDDGSTDESISIAKNYAAQNPGKIKYSEHQNHINKGLSASRNKGIKQAKGKYIAFLDADDVWLPRKLTNQVNIFQKFPEVAMVAEASEYWFNWNGQEKPNKIIPVGAPSDKIYGPGELLKLLYPLGKKSAPCPSGLMLTREAIKKCGGFEESFSRQYQLYEDQAFLHKIYLNEKVFISSDCQNKYRQRTGSIVQRVKADGHYFAVRKFFLEWLEKYIKNEGLNTKETSQLLQKALLPYRKPVYYFITVSAPQQIYKVAKLIIKYPIEFFRKKPTLTHFSHA